MNPSKFLSLFQHIPTNSKSLRSLSRISRCNRSKPPMAFHAWSFALCLAVAVSVREELLGGMSVGGRQEFFSRPAKDWQVMRN